MLSSLLSRDRNISVARRTLSSLSLSPHSLPFLLSLRNISSLFFISLSLHFSLFPSLSLSRRKFRREERREEKSPSFFPLLSLFFSEIIPLSLATEIFLSREESLSSLSSTFSLTLSRSLSSPLLLSSRFLATEITSVVREPQGELSSLFVLSLFSHPSSAHEREK